MNDEQLHLIQISMYLVKSDLISVASHHSPVLAVFSFRGACTVVRTIFFTVHKNGRMIEKNWMERTSGGLSICMGDWNAKIFGFGNLCILQKLNCAEICH